jgi:hypothetical protein
VGQAVDRATMKYQEIYLSSNGLSIIGQSDNTTTALAVQQGGLGVDLGSKLFQLKPATININQPSTQAEGAIKGLLRVSESGDQYESMLVTLLLMPVEQRSYYVGEPGQLNRSPDNLMCFSRDMIRPDGKAKDPQAAFCKSCPKQDWTKWRETHAKADIPGCDAYYYALMVDTVYKMPLQMFIRSTAKKPFEAGMQQLARTFAKLKAQGTNPNIFDIQFTLGTKMIQTGKNQSWIPTFSDFKAISAEDREAFGDIYLQYINRNVQSDEEAQAAAQQEAEQTTQTTIDNAVLDGEYVDKEIVL